MMDDRILGALKQEFESARKRHQVAKEQFWKLSGIPDRDAETTAMLQNAAAEELYALKARIEALKRLNDYLLSGTVPENLKENRQAVQNPPKTAMGTGQ